VPRTSRRRSQDTETDDYLDAADEGRSRRGRRRDEDPDEGESRRRDRRSRFSDDEEDDEPEDEPEEERPRRRRGSREDLADHPGGLDEFANRRDRRSRSTEDREERSERRGRSSRGRDDREERGGRGGRSERRGGSTARKGWGGYRQAADSVKSDFADNLKILDNTDMLIKILDEEPVASYAEHWITIKDGKDEKRRSYVCLGDDCPFCNKLGDRPSVKVCFNVADMDLNPPEVKLWTAGTQVGDILEKFAENPKTSPLNRDDIYWTITRTKKNDRYTTSVRPVKARDLEEDFDTEPLTAEELDELEENLFEADQIYTVKTKAELNKVIADNNLDDEY
jgi:hypothetical protein